MNKESIVQYMAQGLKAVKIASILGCSEAYISEVQREEWFRPALEEAQKKIKKNEDVEKLEDEYIRLESTVLNSIRDNAPFAEFRDLVKLTEVLMRRRQATAPIGGITFNNNTHNTVVLQIPTVVAPEIVVNAQKEVVAVGDQTLAPMSIASVRTLFKEIENKRKAPERILQEIKDVETLEALPEDF